MKRITILLFSSALLLSSCHTLTKTARTAEVGSSLLNATVVDIVPATEHRITYTLEPNEALQRGGENNVKQAAEAEALAKYGNADVLLEPQYVITKQQGLLRSKVTSITVSGRPAYYTNFRTLHDSVWCNPAFRGVYPSKEFSRVLPFNGNKSPKENRYKSKASTYRSKGWTKEFSVFLGTEDGDAFALGALLNIGYQFNPHLEIGAGIGLDFYDFYFDDIPLYGNLRLNLSKKKNHPFLEYKLGGDVLDMDLLNGFAVGYSLGKTDIAFQCLNYTYNGYYDSYNETELGISARFRF